MATVGMKKYTVVWGDTLTSIAKKHGVTVMQLQAWNSHLITDPDKIITGWVLYVDGPAPAIEKKEAEKVNQTKCVIKAFGLQSNTDRTIYASWNWDKESETDKYEVQWQYDTGDGIWFEGAKDEPETKQATYNAPNNALKVRFKVKPVSKKSGFLGLGGDYYKAEWSSWQTYKFSSNPPAEIQGLSVEIVKDKLTASIINIDPEETRATHVQFEIIQIRANGSPRKLYVGTAKINFNSVSFSYNITIGLKYRVRCRAYSSTNKEYGPWSDYTADKGTIPVAPKKITAIRAVQSDGKRGVYIAWEKSATAESYEIAYVTKLEDFEGSNQVTTVAVNDKDTLSYTLYNITSGARYYFRVRAKNTDGESEWTAPAGVVVGSKPEAPTTWSSTTTAVVGEPLNLYWIHNAEDNSRWRFARIKVTRSDGEPVVIPDIQNPNADSDEVDENETCVYAIDTSEYPEGVSLKWQVQTAGITQELGELSIERTIDIYAKPTLELDLRGKDDEALDEDGDQKVVDSFPIYISGVAGPNSNLQHPTSYHVAVVSNGSYDTVDQVGNAVTISKGDLVYSSHVDTGDISASYTLAVELSAGNIDLANNQPYTVKVTVAMSSGLTAEATQEIVVAWSEDEYQPNAEIAFDPETYTTIIRPYCMDYISNGVYELSENVELSVYRREYDGRFIKLHTEDIPNRGNESITDPHPALDYARYRIVARSTETGAVGYFDVPGIPTQIPAVIIQWNEDWTNFDVVSEDAPAQPLWTGSLLKLPYNIKVNTNHNPDVTLAEYIGRAHPVGYYGTQIGESATWNVDIDKNDKETVYALRRLAKWMGDVYVREPSGSGYWAHIVVSFNESYDSLVIPVTFAITRVEGGI